MTKLRVLQQNQKFFSYIGIHFDGSTKSTTKSLATYYLVMCPIVANICSLAFVHNNWNDFKGVLEAFLVIIAVNQSVGAYLTIRFKVNDVQLLHIQLQEIVDKGNFALEIILKTSHECEALSALLSIKFVFFHLKIKSIRRNLQHLPKHRAKVSTIHKYYGALHILSPINFLRCILLFNSQYFHCKFRYIDMAIAIQFVRSISYNINFGLVFVLLHTS